LSSARRASVSNSWFSPQRSGGVNQEFTAQLARSPRSEAEGGTICITCAATAPRKYLRRIFRVRLMHLLDSPCRSSELAKRLEEFHGRLVFEAVASELTSVEALEVRWKGDASLDEKNNLLPV